MNYCGFHIPGNILLFIYIIIDMAKINLETELRFKGAMKSLGFKKTSRYFEKRVNDVSQKIMFGHATMGEHHVRYYSLTYSIEFNSITYAAKEMGVMVYALGGLIDYIMPPHKGLMEWRLSEDDTDEYYVKMIDDILSKIRQFVLPFMEKYITIEQFLEGVEGGCFAQLSLDKKTVPIAYYLIGEKQKAFDYIVETLARYERDAAPVPFHERFVTDVYEKDVYHFNQNGNLLVYQDFAEKFTNWVNQRVNR